jgi:membrane glycosyltransferase
MATRRRSPRPPELEENYGLLQAVLDPYVNAVHISLLRSKEELPSAIEERFVGLRAALLADGPAALAPGDRLALLMDADSMSALHEAVWSAPAARLAGWWRLALEHYNVIAPAPETAFSLPGPEAAAASHPLS